MRFVAGLIQNEDGGVNVAGIIATVLGLLTGLVTLITFLAKSIYRVKPGEQAIVMWRKRVVRIKKTAPVEQTPRRWFYFFGPTRKDARGAQLLRDKRRLWWKVRVKPPKDAENPLDTQYGQILVLGPGIYFVLWLLGEVLPLNTQDNPDSTVVITSEMPDPANSNGFIQREHQFGLKWGVKYSGPGEYYVGMAVIKGMNGLQRLVELACSDALRELHELGKFSYQELGSAQTVYDEVNSRVRDGLEKYGVELRAITIPNRYRTMGQMLKEARTDPSTVPVINGAKNTNGHVNGHVHESVR